MDVTASPGRRFGLVGRFALASLVAVAAMGLAVSAVLAGQLRERQVQAAEFHAKFVTESILRYELTPDDLEFLRPMEGRRYQEVAAFVRNRITQWPILGVTLWRSDGEIVFSSDRSLIGRTLPVDDGVEDAFRTGRTVSAATEPENDVAGRVSESRLLDTYVPVSLDPTATNAIPVAVFEVSQDYSAIDAEVHKVFRTIGFTLLAGLFFLYIVLIPIMRRVSRTLSQQNQQLSDQAERLNGLLVQEQEAVADRKRLLDRTMRAAEEERSRMAADLHDGPIQRLAAIGYKLDRAGRRLDKGEVGASKELIGQLQDDVEEEMRRLRGMMSELRPPVLDQRGLESALRDHVRAVSSKNGLRCEIQGSLSDRLDPEVETVLYRVAQEAMTNVVKHAAAERVQLSLLTNNGTVGLEVADDGVGFDLEEAAQLAGRDHFGLMAMRERVETAGGRWEIHSEPGAGTWIRAVLPREEVHSA